jgi:hypothetical protein
MTDTEKLLRRHLKPETDFERVMNTPVLFLDGLSFQDMIDQGREEELLRLLEASFDFSGGV